MCVGVLTFFKTSQKWCLFAGMQKVGDMSATNANKINRNPGKVVLDIHARKTTLVADKKTMICRSCYLSRKCTAGIYFLWF